MMDFHSLRLKAWVRDKGKTTKTTHKRQKKLKVKNNQNKWHD